MTEWKNERVCDVLNLILGAFLVVSPWMFSFASGTPSQNAIGRKQTASVGTSRMSVCSTGSTARTAGKSGTNKNAARAKARRAHPRSRGAGARPSAMLRSGGGP